MSTTFGPNVSVPAYLKGSCSLAIGQAAVVCECPGAGGINNLPAGMYQLTFQDSPYTGTVLFQVDVPSVESSRFSWLSFMGHAGTTNPVSAIGIVGISNNTNSSSLSIYNATTAPVTTNWQLIKYL